jgi:hypothetical protein
LKVSELIALIQNLPQDAEVVQSRDSKGNGYAPARVVDLGRYADGVFDRVGVSSEGARHCWSIAHNALSAFANSISSGFVVE